MLSRAFRQLYPVGRAFASSAAADTQRVWVGNLPFAVTEEHLTEHFKSGNVGPVHEVFLLKDKETQR